MTALALGRVGLFDTWVLAAITAAGALAGALSLPALARSVRIPEGRATRVLLALVAAALLLDLVASAVPPTSADALRYHLTVPEYWLELGRIDDPFWTWQGFSPFGIEMLFAQGLAFGGSEVAGAIGGILAALAALAVYALARELRGDALACVCAAALFALQGVVTWEATSLFVEIGLTFYSTLALRHAIAFARAPAPSTAAWTGLCAGAAAGTKYIGLLPAALVLGAAAVVAVRCRATRLVAWLAVPALLSGGGWYLRNWIATGNPLYPLYFGGKGWGADDQPFIDGLAGYGTGSVARLPLLPFDLIAHGDEFDRGRYVGIGIFVFALAALVLRRRRPVVLTLWAGVVVYLVVWWTGSAQARFMLPALAVLAALGGLAAADLLRGRRGHALPAAAVLAAGVVVWAASSGALTRRLLPPAFGLESRADATERLTGTYDVLHAVRPRVEGTLAVAGYAQIYHYPGRAIALDSPDFGPGTPRAFALARLRAYGVGYVLAPRIDDGVPQMRPLRGCLRPVASFEGRFVTSRSLRTSMPFPLVLYSLRPECRRA